MTDKYLTHAEAAKAEAEGKDVQTFLYAKNCWIPFEWDHLNTRHAKFRLAPPAPRVAREWWINDNGYSLCTFLSADEANRWDSSARKEIIHVREVLPGEPSVKEAVRDALTKAAVLAESCYRGFDAERKIEVLRRELCGDDE